MISFALLRLQHPGGEYSANKCCTSADGMFSYIWGFFKIWGWGVGEDMDEVYMFSLNPSFIRKWGWVLIWIWVIETLMYLILSMVHLAGGLFVTKDALGSVIIYITI